MHLRSNATLAGLVLIALGGQVEAGWTQSSGDADQQQPAASGPQTAVDPQIVDYEVIVAPLNSVYQDIPTLIDKMKNDPSEAIWAGGPAGGPDQAMVKQVAEALGVDPTKVIYKAFPSSAEAAQGIAGGQADIAMVPLSAVAQKAEDGDVRILAIASEQPLQGLAVPTFRDQGIDVSTGKQPAAQ
jgi:tripartite-type tricarboxylate transporter receptor subunit TctC